MSYFSVVRSAGPAWIDGGIAAQSGVDDHAAFMNGLADEGFVLFAGPLAGTESGRLRALFILNADSEHEIRRRLADDPWVLSERLEITASSPGISSSEAIDSPNTPPRRRNSRLGSDDGRRRQRCAATTSERRLPRAMQVPRPAPRCGAATDAGPGREACRRLPTPARAAPPWPRLA